MSDRIDPSGIPLRELAEALEGVLEGDGSVLIEGAAGLEDAAPGTVVRVENSRYLARAVASEASALLLPPELGPVGKPAIRVPDARRAFIRCLELFSRELRPAPGVHPTAVLGEGVELGEGCSVGPLACLGDRVRLGKNVVVHAAVVLGEDSAVGEDSVLFPRVVLYPRSILGARVRVHAGAVIGADGFGYEWGGDRLLRKPHNGRVRIGDDVEIGANTTIDRATTAETVIGSGTKIDNLVQIAHNVRTGAHCLIAAQCGVAGSSTLGSGVVLAGQVGVPDHVSIGDQAQLAARTGVWGDLPGGEVYGGYPARPRGEERRIIGALGRLPELLKRVRELEKRVGVVAPNDSPQRSQRTQREQGTEGKGLAADERG